MLYEFESDVKIDDDILKQELGANSDVKLKNIVRTIQKEQNAIIRNTQDKILAIQGVAGSGKTSVALHRIAYLLYHDREYLNSSNIMILSPGGVFSDYISHILPELGEENIQEMSFDLFAYRELKGIAVDCEDKFHQIERQIAAAKENGSESTLTEPGKMAVKNDDRFSEEARYTWKQSEAYVRAVEGFLIELEDRLIDFRDVEYKDFHKSANEIMEFFYFKFTNIPVLSRMEAVMDYFIDEYETAKGKDLTEEEKELVQEQFLNMYVTRDVYQIYNWILEDYDYPTLPDLPVDQRILKYEDVYPILYLKYRIQAGNIRKNIRHLVIDEMQDYSYLQYVILSRLFTCNMTILGDKAQTVDTKTRDVLEFLPKIFGKKVRRIVMNKSYRNTAQISAYAESVSGITGIEYVNRQGKEVTRWNCADNQEACELILDAVHIGEEQYETAAVLAMTEAEALNAYEYLKARGKNVHYIDRDSSHFRKGITVTTYYQAKGLEFDQVFVLKSDRENAFWPQYQYICATRALHELYICE